MSDKKVTIIRFAVSLTMFVVGAWLSEVGPKTYDAGRLCGFLLGYGGCLFSLTAGEGRWRDGGASE